MTLPRTAIAGSACVTRAALFGMIALLAALAGCIADGPGGSPMGIAVAGKETVDAAEDADAPAEADVAVAAREAKAAAETGTISGSAALDRLIERHAAEAGVPAPLAYAVVRVESRYNPKARGNGVYGLSQIKPATARSLGFSGPTSALLDADTNLTYGMKYLKGAWEKGGHDVCQTAMKYKGGHRATRMTRSASAYCSKVKQHMAALAERRRAPALAVPATTRETAEAPASRPATDAPASRAADAATERGRQNGVPRPKPAPAADQASAAPATTEAGDAKLADATETPKAATETVQRTDTASAKGGRLRPEGNGRSS